MGNEKITGNMNPIEFFMTMCEGNPGAMNIIMQMMNTHRGFMDVLLCDSLNIRGSKLYMLYNDCCENNVYKFNRTLMMLRCGVYSQEQIQTNLNLVRAIPFIDDSLVIAGIPSYGETFGPTDKGWDEYCNKNKEAFTQKLNNIIEQQHGKKKM